MNEWVGFEIASKGDINVSIFTQITGDLYIICPREWKLGIIKRGRRVRNLIKDNLNILTNWSVAVCVHGFWSLDFDVNTNHVNHSIVAKVASVAETTWCRSGRPQNVSITRELSFQTCCTCCIQFEYWSAKSLLMHTVCQVWRGLS